MTSSTTRLTSRTSLVMRVEMPRQHVVRHPGPVGGHRVLATTPAAARPGGRRCARRPARRPSARRRAARPGTARCRGRARPRSAPRGRSRRPRAARRAAPAVTSPMMRIPRPGPGNGWRHTIASGSPSSSPTRRTSSLNSVRSGSTSANCRSSGRPPTLWWRLDVGGAGAAAGLDDVGVERALHEEVDRLPVRAGLGDDLAGGLLEDPDELAADGLALLLGVGDAGERVEEALRRRRRPSAARRWPRRSRARPARPRPCAAARGRRRRR